MQHQHPIATTTATTYTYASTTTTQKNTTTQCKFPEHKLGICASGCKGKHHWRKLQGVKPPRVQVDSYIYIYIYIIYNYTTQTTTTQCKLPECKCSICASGWMKKHHQCKLQRVNHHVCKWTICASGCRIKHHQRKLQLVTTTTCASGMVAPVERRETP